MRSTPWHQRMHRSKTSGSATPTSVLRKLTAPPSRPSEWSWLASRWKISSEGLVFFKETFLLADTSVEVILGMPFPTLSNADVSFAERELTWRSYTAAEALPTTKRVELIDKKEFDKAALDENVEAFVVYVTSLSLGSMSIHPAREAQIASLLTEEVTIPAEYCDGVRAKPRSRQVE